jgi:hypothetical protein
MSGELELMRKSDEEIVEGLKTCNIPALSDINMPDSVDGYEYVLRMRIDRVKASAIDELNRQIDNKNEQYTVLEKETASSLWKKDLDDFIEAWKTYTVKRNAEIDLEKKSSTDNADKKTKRKIKIPTSHV